MGLIIGLALMAKKIPGWFAGGDPDSQA